MFYNFANFMGQDIFTTNAKNRKISLYTCQQRRVTFCLDRGERRIVHSRIYVGQDISRTTKNWRYVAGIGEEQGIPNNPDRLVAS